MPILHSWLGSNARKAHQDINIEPRSDRGFRQPLVERSEVGGTGTQFLEPERAGQVYGIKPLSASISARSPACRVSAGESSTRR